MNQRSQYLKALGIEQWVLRNAAIDDVCPVEAQEVVQRKAVIENINTAPVVSVQAEINPLQDWRQLRDEVRSCTKCSLHQHRQQTVFGAGKQNADWLIIGEAPGAEEDQQGEPFVGAAGQLLTAMLKAIDLPREEVYIANVLKCRPPNNRDPQADEIAHCDNYLQRQIALIKPKIILTFGRVASQSILKTEKPIGKLRGVVHHFQGTTVPVIATYHPSYLLRSPGEKRKSWEDLKLARQTFSDLSK